MNNEDSDGDHSMKWYSNYNVHTLKQIQDSSLSWNINGIRIWNSITVNSFYPGEIMPTLL